MVTSLTPGPIVPSAACRPGVTVVVMAYNEVETLRDTVAEIRVAIDGLGGAGGDILVVDDGSTDGTGEAAEQLATADAHVRVVHHPANLGLGEVYRTGLTVAERQFVTFFPADGQFPASIIVQFYQLAQGHDLVLGFLPERRDPIGQVLSWLQRALYRTLVGRLPRFQGVLMLRRELLNVVQVAPSGRAATLVFELILKVSRSGYRIVSVPTDYRPRLKGLSKVNNWRTIRSNIVAALALRRRMRRTSTEWGTGDVDIAERSHDRAKVR